MREFFRSLTDFSLSLSVFSVGQTAKTLQALPTGKAPDVAQSFLEATNVLKSQFGTVENSLYKSGEAFQNAVLGAPGTSDDQPAATVVNTPEYRTVSPPPTAATSYRGRSRIPVNFPPDAHSVGSEELIILYTIGTGKFSDGPPFYINLLTDNYDFDGNWIGYQAGVNFSDSPPQASFAIPNPPSLPITSPPVPPLPATSWTKAVFTFKDGALIVEGPALTHLTPVKGGGFLFSVTTSHIVTGGTQLYEGAKGIKAATGTAFVPQELFDSGRFPSPGLEFPVTTMETFRVVRKQLQAEAVD